jgi:hypothetical protein
MWQRKGPTSALIRCRVAAGAATGSLIRVNRFDDDDDWVGTPPEGRYSRDRANPEFWWRQRPISIAGALLGVIVIVVIVVALLR